MASISEVPGEGPETRGLADVNYGRTREIGKCGGGYVRDEEAFDLPSPDKAETVKVLSKGSNIINCGKRNKKLSLPRR